MIKVYNIKSILKITAIILLFAIIIAILSNKISMKKVIETSSNSKSTYKILVDVEESKLYLFENDILSKELRHANLRLMAVDAEVHALKQSLVREKQNLIFVQEELSREKSHVLMMQVPYYRYMKMASLVPNPIKRAIYKLYKFLKK